VEPILVNGEEGRVAHEIDVEHPRQDGTHVLDDLAERVRTERALFGLAYDFDADRGSLTYVDAAGREHIPSPQASAAMNTAIALAVHRRSGDRRRAAVVASDATSCRVKRVAAAFGADLFEVETGEINVVTRMRDLELRGLCAVVGVEGPNGGTVFAGTTCRDGTLVGAGALLAAADSELRGIIGSTLAPGRTIGPALAGFIELLPVQRSLAQKHSAPADWKATVDALDRDFPRVFASELSAVWERFDIVYSYTGYVGPERPAAAGYGWKARLFRPGSEGFLWIRGSKTEAGVARVIGDAPDEPSARALVELGGRLLAR
jgi:phosphomannomutase